MRTPQPKPTAQTGRIGLNIKIPASEHRAAKVASVSRGLTWDQAATEAVDAWARGRGSARQQAVKTKAPPQRPQTARGAWSTQTE